MNKTIKIESHPIRTNFYSNFPSIGVFFERDSSKESRDLLFNFLSRNDQFSTRKVAVSQESQGSIAFGK